MLARHETYSSKGLAHVVRKELTRFGGAFVFASERQLLSSKTGTLNGRLGGALPTGSSRRERSGGSWAGGGLSAFGARHNLPVVPRSSQIPPSGQPLLVSTGARALFLPKTATCDPALFVREEASPLGFQDNGSNREIETAELEQTCETIGGWLRKQMSGGIDCT